MGSLSVTRTTVGAPRGPPTRSVSRKCDQAAPESRFRWRSTILLHTYGDLLKALVDMPLGLSDRIAKNTILGRFLFRSKSVRSTADGQEEGAPPPQSAPSVAPAHPAAPGGRRDQAGLWSRTRSFSTVDRLFPEFSVNSMVEKTLCASVKSATKTVFSSVSDRCAEVAEIQALTNERPGPGGSTPGSGSGTQTAGRPDDHGRRTRPGRGPRQRSSRWCGEG
jgi:hypothetical protein